MKKALFTVALASVIAAVSAEPLKIDGNFKKIRQKTAFLDLWQKSGAGVKEATFTLTKTKDGHDIAIKTGKKYATLVANGQFPLKIGDTVKIRITLKGKANNCSVGFYLNTAKGAWVNAQNKIFPKIDCKDFTVLEGTLKLVPEKKVYTYGNLHITLPGNADVTIRNISVEYVR